MITNALNKRRSSRDKPTSVVQNPNRKRSRGNLAGVGIFCFLSLLFLTSCSDLNDGWLVLQGNYWFERGEYQKASLAYLAVRKEGRSNAWVQYNLGNVYNALGEANTALALWNTVDNKTPDELLFRLSFNKGCLLYQKGIYQAAYESFQKALTLRPTSLDAKRNLELSLLKIQNFGAPLPNRTDNAAAPAPAAGPEARALLDYIHRLEGNRWKNSSPEKGASGSSQDW